jgi:hypothetical protein
MLDKNLTSGGVYATISIIVFKFLWIVYGFLCMLGVGRTTCGQWRWRRHGCIYRSDVAASNDDQCIMEQFVEQLLPCESIWNKIIENSGTLYSSATRQTF